jgi:predicted glycoside hydrolase/deacetylase ChbG (UPF0249 family)
MEPAMTAPARPPVGIVLCADDYGLVPGIGRAVRALIEAGRLTATSCMTFGRHWPAEAALIRPLRDRADVGLHFTLTDHVPMAPMPRLAPDGRLPPLGALIRRALLGAIDETEVAAELERQLDAFERHVGRSPDHLDGHHHVHQLPGIGRAVLAVFERRLRIHGTRLRYCDEPLAAVLARRVAVPRAAVIGLLGRRFQTAARARGIPGNARFAGVRDFAPGEDYAVLFLRFVAGAVPGTLIMCHPGFADPELAALDSVTAQREEEYRYLMGDGFPAVLAAAGVRLVRFAEL